MIDTLYRRRFTFVNAALSSPSQTMCTFKCAESATYSHFGEKSEKKTEKFGMQRVNYERQIISHGASINRLNGLEIIGLRVKHKNDTSVRNV